MHLKDLIDEHAVASFDKQMHLRELTANLDWSFQMETGLLSFGNRQRWRAQILGTESMSSRTWLWAWANEASGIPPRLLMAAGVMRHWGERLSIPELTEPEVPLRAVDGYLLALVASGLCHADGYYRGEYPGGSAYLLVSDENYPRRADCSAARVLSVLPQALTSLPIGNHKTALLAYLKYCGLAGCWDGNTFTAHEQGRTALTASFDERDRLVQLWGELGRADAEDNPPVGSAGRDEPPPP